MSNPKKAVQISVGTGTVVITDVPVYHTNEEVEKKLLIGEAWIKDRLAASSKNQIYLVWEDVLDIETFGEPQMYAEGEGMESPKLTPDEAFAMEDDARENMPEDLMGNMDSLLGPYPPPPLFKLTKDAPKPKKYNWNWHIEGLEEKAFYLLGWTEPDRGHAVLIDPETNLIYVAKEVPL